MEMLSGVLAVVPALPTSVSVGGFSLAVIRRISAEGKLTPEAVHSIVEDLPAEAISHILRHLSSTARAVHWTCNAPAATVRSLFLSDGPFRSADPSIFRTVTTVSGPFPTGEMPAPCGAVLSVASDADHQSLAALVESAGASLVSLEVLHSWQKQLYPPSHSAWALAVAAHSSSLRELSVTVTSTRRCRVTRAGRTPPCFPENAYDSSTRLWSIC